MSRALPAGWFAVFAGLLWTLAAASAAEPVRVTTGHVDLRIEHVPDREPPLDILVDDDDTRQTYAATNAILVAAEAARLELPGDIPPLGNAGDSLWVLPQSQNPALLFLGFSAEGIPTGVFAGNLELRLVALEGPGHFFFWQSDLGSLQFHFNSRDGLSDEDVFLELPGGHNHGNWGFTTAGVYRATFQAVGRRVGEVTNVMSPPVTFTFHVEPLPPVITSGFAAWQEQHWPGVTNAAVVGADADPDGDRRRNLEEYALGADPRLADRADPGGPTIQATTSSVSVLLAWQPREDLEILLERREGEGGWSAVSGSPATAALPPVNGAPRESLSWTEPAVNGEAARLYRIRYELTGVAAALR